MDTIFIEQLRVRGKHGHLDEERTREQEFLLDISINFDTRQSANSDDLSHTVDYDFFRTIAKQTVEKESFKLLERVADTVATRILADQRISSVSVTIRKTEMYQDCRPGLTVVRARA